MSPVSRSSTRRLSRPLRVCKACITAMAIIVAAMSMVALLFRFLSWQNSELLPPALQPSKSSPIIYAITPTVSSSEQVAHLIRLGQTFALAASSSIQIHWIVIEDAAKPSETIDRILKRFQTDGLVGTTHLAIETPDSMKLSPKEPRHKKYRGVVQRNEALRWLRTNIHKTSNQLDSGIVYFADDDNTYDVHLFELLSSRGVKANQIIVWPVGLVGRILYEGPICSPTNLTIVIGWRTSWRPDRLCACDMAGFALPLRRVVVDKPEVEMPSQTDDFGMLEAEFLAKLFNESPGRHKVPAASLITPLVCDQILVWHTRTMPSDLTLESKVADKAGKPLITV